MQNYPSETIELEAEEFEASNSAVHNASERSKLPAIASIFAIPYYFFLMSSLALLEKKDKIFKKGKSKKIYF